MLHNTVCYITHDMLCYITHHMLCYITDCMLCYITYHTSDKEDYQVLRISYKTLRSGHFDVVVVELINCKCRVIVRNQIW